MPSGATHDRITLWSLPLVVGLSYQSTRSGGLTLLVAGGYLFSGLMFGPDLDIHSRHYRRWGLLRWIWLPYRRGMKHRSLLSHGPLIGTIVRLVYLSLWLGGLGLIAVALGAIAAETLGQVPNGWEFSRQMITQSQEGLGRSLQVYWKQGLALVLGMELGAFSHVLSDWSAGVGNRWKRRVRGKKKRDRSTQIKS